ncbi:YigZ family protein [Halarcobacter ebronensis]|uniref:YigZ family protein n=1 Tax=Halarcobacter ebronensis TaxID=1462615 RepID=A0A4V1LQX5_9BACT|nr:YigZ family protein [Halarcobacter ebronensis]RXJ66218.1 YigZ family protein [Halarcobacter ebronensis]
MYFVKDEYTQTFEEKKSKFIAYLTPYEKFDELMQRLRQEHPKARHFVYAYRYLNEFDQVVENSSDDGEPKGTSGKPCLNVLAGHEIINSAVITVRYFGGVKLGTGGLVRAYSDAVNKVISSANLIKYEKLERLILTFAYSQLSKIEYLINGLNIIVSNKDFQNSVVLTLQTTKEQKESLLNELPRDIKIKI